MSSTNRGYERHKTDYYVTPVAPIKKFLTEFVRDESIDPTLHTWFDPCAGGDALNPMSYPVALREAYNVTALTLDIREDSLADVKGDYLLTPPPYTPNIIITNPPFFLAKEIVSKALLDVADNGYVIMLLRLNFFGSKDRYPFFQQQLPVSAYVHHRRFSFTTDGKTDSIEYMHAVWQKNNYPQFTKLKVI